MTGLVLNVYKRRTYFFWSLLRLGPVFATGILSPVWVRGCRIGPLRFLAGWRRRRLNPAFSFVLV